MLIESALNNHLQHLDQEKQRNDAKKEESQQEYQKWLAQKKQQRVQKSQLNTMSDQNKQSEKEERQIVAQVEYDKWLRQNKENERYNKEEKRNYQMIKMQIEANQNARKEQRKIECQKEYALWQEKKSKRPFSASFGDRLASAGTRQLKTEKYPSAVSQSKMADGINDDIIHIKNEISSSPPVNFHIQNARKNGAGKSYISSAELPSKQKAIPKKAASSKTSKAQFDNRSANVYSGVKNKSIGGASKKGDTIDQYVDQETNASLRGNVQMRGSFASDKGRGLGSAQTSNKYLNSEKMGGKNTTSMKNKIYGQGPGMASEQSNDSLMNRQPASVDLRRGMPQQQMPANAKNTRYNPHSMAAENQMHQKFNVQLQDEDDDLNFQREMNRYENDEETNVPQIKNVSQLNDVNDISDINQYDMEQDIYDEEFEEPLGDEDGLDDYGS